MTAQPRGQTATFDQSRIAREARRRREARVAAGRGTLRVLALAVVAALFWASAADLPQLAYAEGTIEPEGALRPVEHVAGGQVADIRVTEGQRVRAGDVLVLLSDAGLGTEVSRLEARARVLSGAIARLDRLSSLVGNDPQRPVNLPQDARIETRLRAQVDVYENRRQRLAAVVTRKQGLRDVAAELAESVATLEAVALTELRNAQTLLARGSFSRLAVSEAQARHLAVLRDRLRAQSGVTEAEADVEDARTALDEYHAGFLRDIAQERGEMADERTLVQSALADLRRQQDRLAIRAPVDGVVHQLLVHSAGEVVSPGGLVAEVLPVGETLIAVIRLRPRDIGQVDTGARVELRSTSFSPKAYGVLEGTIVGISPTSRPNEDGVDFFEVRVALAEQFIGAGDLRTPLRAGLEVNAAVVTGSRTVLDYVIDPVAGPFRQAFHER